MRKVCSKQEPPLEPPEIVPTITYHGGRIFVKRTFFQGVQGLFKAETSRDRSNHNISRREDICQTDIYPRVAL